MTFWGYEEKSESSVNAKFRHMHFFVIIHLITESLHVQPTYYYLNYLVFGQKGCIEIKCSFAVCSQTGHIQLTGFMFLIIALK